MRQKPDQIPIDRQSVPWRAPIAGFAARSIRFVRTLGPLGITSLVILVLMVVTAVVAPALGNYDPRGLVGERLSPPSGEFWFGTDHLGRDLYSRLVWGARISLYVGIVSVSIGVTTGFIFGVVAAYIGGKLDLLGQRVIDSLMAFPGLILALGLMAVLGASVNNVVLALSIITIPSAARTSRSLALGLKENVYIEAARSIGASQRRIILRHILPNALAAYWVLYSLYVGRAIIAESSLSFLGLGVPPDVPSWGGMIGEGRGYMAAAPWFVIFPGIAIGLIVYGFNLLGDSLRDALDPKLRGR